MLLCGNTALKQKRLRSLIHGLLLRPCSASTERSKTNVYVLTPRSFRIKAKISNDFNSVYAALLRF
jgi:hypothetical protein